MKLFYLGYFSAMGVYLPYLGLYLGAVGLPGTQIGLIASMFPLASMLMPPLWGVLSDHFGWRKQLLIAALLAAVITSLLIWQITHIFVALFIFIIVLAIAISPTIPLADAITLQWVGEHGGSYGSIRVYGSLGFLIAAIVAGSILNVIGVTSLFLLLAIVFCGPLLTSFFVPGQNKVSMARIKGHELVVLLRDRTLLLFIVLCMIGYGTFAAYNTFFGLYLKSLGVSTSAIGLASGLASLSELPVMMLSGILMKRLGARWLLIIGLSVAVVRWLAYATFTTYPILFAFTLLHGISFASFYVAAITFIDQRVPIHMRTTGQTLFYGTSFGLGTWASTNLFGVLYERLHGSGMYFVGAALCTASIVGLLLLIPRKPARADL
ncbi:MFS transporter [Dictyobacter alpinus]|nr:MFS transporter [Dictyobacter alpinus]